jgi:hypothetical protein
MECLTAKDKINKTFIEVSELSKSKNTKIIDQIVIDNILDRIIEFQSNIQGKADKINFINSKFQELTWVNNIDNECLLLLRKLIDTSKVLHNKMIKYYVSLNWAIKRGIANEAMKNFKLSLDDLKEYNQDLEDLFFNLPEDEYFTERVNLLSK